MHESKGEQRPHKDYIKSEETEEPSLCFHKIKRFGDKRTVPLFPGEVMT
jgi:hypothetical protein